MAFSSRFCASAVSISAACSAISARASSGREVPAEELGHQAQSHRELVGLAVVQREDPVLVAGEVGELPDVVPHPLVGGVEQVGAVLVDLDTGLRLRLGVGVAADVGSPFEHEDTLAELRRHALGDRQAEESGSDDEEVIASGGQGRSEPGELERSSAARVSDPAAEPPWAGRAACARIHGTRVTEDPNRVSWRGTDGRRGSPRQGRDSLTIRASSL